MSFKVHFFHLLKKMLKYSLIAPFLWFALTINTRRIILSVLGSVVFSCLECSFYKITTGRYYTTKEQFVANIIFMPFIVEDYNYIFGNSNYKHLIYPFNIWIFELIMGYCFILIYGYNPAWHYKGKHAILRGQIDISCYPRWILLSLIQDFLYFSIFVDILSGYHSCTIS